MKKHRIMFVCLGNICRSPMSEFILKDMVAKAGRSEQFVIASAATSDEEIVGGVGNPVYPPAREELAKHGIHCGGKRAVWLKADDYDAFDLFLCMDHNNLRHARRILKNDPEGKVRMLLEERDVADPWFTDRFEVAYRDIYEGCERLLRELAEANAAE